MPKVKDLALTRRRFLLGGICLAAARPTRVWATPRFDDDPFTLGIASGYPSPDGFTLWTRLAPRPFEPGGGMPTESVEVHWEVAHDAGFKRVIVQGEARADAAWGHSIHIDVAGLPADRAYCYRFRIGDAVSPTGRTRTAPATTAESKLLRLALASCQHYEHGYYAAYRHMLADDLDLVVHVGDYIYEGSWGPTKVRPHVGADPHTLAEYRIRYACYKTDPDLQNAHAAYPWLAVWDDHEVENDYARDRSVYYAENARLLARRAAGYQAYYEHLPLPARMRPTANAMPIYTATSWGRLAQLALLDTRQYRSYPPCNNALADDFGRKCGVRSDPAATLLGPVQEAWLDHALRVSTAQWNLVAQQLLMARSDGSAGPAESLQTQSWDGYPAARNRMLDSFVEHQVANPIVLSGDVHNFWVNDLRRDFLDPAQTPVAAEIVTTSISSFGGTDDYITQVRRDAPHVKFATARFRGYARLDVTPARTICDLRAVAQIEDPASNGYTLSSWIVEDGRPGITRA